MQWDDILSQEEAIHFVERYEPRAYGTWYNYEAREDVPEIMIRTSDWRGFMCHMSHKSFGCTSDNAQDGTACIGKTAMIEYSRSSGMIDALREMAGEDKKEEIDRLAERWEHDGFYGFWFRFTCAEDGHEFSGCDWSRRLE